ncbi:glycosyltransferase [Spirochaeta lutea]|uniref:Glycosyl transferase family 1 domain-containing protein n=1 Tax=Spirochaeta lutea TaxID=1480694 RepID=A0A098QUQ8_9SPIO|nr:glycosyltransferase [Spirochaeta lutea]KGE71138.1 hypothetical protein DC28_12885 [Spirochaeta lutea]
MIYILGNSESIFIEDYLRVIGAEKEICLLDTSLNYIPMPHKGRDESNPEYWWEKARKCTASPLRKFGWYFSLGMCLTSNDTLHIHYLGGAREVIILLGAKLRRANSIITFWGSDLFVPVNTFRFLMKKIAVFLSSLVSLSTDEMKEFFYKKYRYKKQVNMARFALPNIENIKELCKKHSDDEQEKFRIKVGYNARSQQQHIPILQELEKIPAEVKSKITVYLPLGYGRSDLDYLGALKAVIASSTIEIKSNESFLSDIELAKSTLETDVFINLQETDAQSASMQEHMFAGSIVITGNWLPYDKLRKEGCYFHSIDSIGCLSETLSQILGDIEVEKQKASVNTSIIDRISSWAAVKSQWLDLYNGARR